MAEYKCIRCGYEYKSSPGPTQCFRCGHLYVKWINYEEMYQLVFKNQIEEYYKNRRTL